jgi:hypothetical protein
MTLATAAARSALVGALVLSILALGASSARAGVTERTSYVTSGGYRTLATIWNASAGARFTCPAGAKIRVIYGYGWLSKTRQSQTLDCFELRQLSVGTAWSKFGARFQIKVPESGNVTWWYVTEGP